MRDISQGKNNFSQLNGFTQPGYNKVLIRSKRMGVNTSSYTSPATDSSTNDKKTDIEPLFASVIIPVKNGAEVLPACLSGLARQTIPVSNFEVIVVDDGSTDQTTEVVKRTVESWTKTNGPRLRLILEQSVGAAAARNRGVAASHGEILFFTDADCEPADDWLETVLNLFEDPEITGVTGRYNTRQSSIIAKLCQVEFENRYNYVRNFETIDFLFTHSAAVRKDAFNEVGGFDIRMPNSGEDLEFAYKLIRADKKLVFSNQAVVFHRHPYRMVDYIKKKISRGYWRTLIMKRYPVKIKADTYTPPGLKFQIGLSWCILSLAGLGFIASILGFFMISRIIFILLSAGLVSFFISTFPFLKKIRGDWRVKFFAPLFLFIQAASIGLGVIKAIPCRIEDFTLAGRR
jgi:cellulose synthase/poly-beta-1,6-N-acetylglucosamine synthase-like glycosyltransferase